MEYRIFNDTAVIRLDKGDEITDAITSVAKKEKIFLASIYGIGAVDMLEAGVYDLNTLSYNKFVYTGNCEINALVGDLTAKDGEPYLHLHITCTDKDGKVIGGHLLKGRISITAEIFVNIVEGKAERSLDPELKFNRIKFD